MIGRVRSGPRQRPADLCRTLPGDQREDSEAGFHGYVQSWNHQQWVDMHPRILGSFRTWVFQQASRCSRPQRARSSARLSLNFCLSFPFPRFLSGPVGAFPGNHMFLLGVPGGVRKVPRRGFRFPVVYVFFFFFSPVPLSLDPCAALLFF